MSKKRKMIQAQINPHFFYNTLNGMLALNRMGEKKKLEKTIMNLADLFRYSSVGGEDTATLEEECRICQAYLELERLKYSNTIEYEIHVEEACKGRRIPKMLLQPILENSMAHGIGGRGQSLTITVDVSAADTEADSLTKIIIRDNGIGFDSEEILKETEDSGIGYVKEQVKAFDSEAVFICRSEPGGGTETMFIFGEER